MKFQFFLKNMKQIWKSFESPYVREYTLSKRIWKTLFLQNKVSWNWNYCCLETELWKSAQGVKRQYLTKYPCVYTGHEHFHLENKFMAIK